MVFFIISLIVFIVGVILQAKSSYDMTGFSCALFGGIFALIVGLFIFIPNLPAVKEDTRIQLQEQYKAYTSDTSVVLASDIAEYNAKIISGKKYQKNFWIGAFIPNIYDEFELIEVSE